MQAILPFVRQGFSGRRSRNLFLAAAVALASALVAAVGCAIATAQDNMLVQMHRAIGEEDARIIHEYSSLFPAEVTHRARSLPGVKAAAGRMRGSLTLAQGSTRPGELHPRRATVQARGVDIDGDEGFDQVKILEGRAAQEEKEVMLDALAREQLAAKVGDQLIVQRFGDPITLTVCGIYERPRLGALQRGHVQLSRALLAQATGAEDEVNVVSIVLKDGVDVLEWVAANKDKFKAPLALEPSEAVMSGISRGLQASKLLMWMATMVASLACAFIVATGMTTALAEQQREIAILRSLGASRAQVLLGQLTMGLTIGVTGALVGIPLGVAIAWCIANYLVGQLPNGFSVAPSAIACAIAAGLVASVGGAAYPAWLASRVSPLEALAVRSRPARAHAAVWLFLIASLCLVLQWGVMQIADDQERFWNWMIVGVPLLALGWFCMGVPMVTLLARTSSPTLERLLRLPRGVLAGSMRASPYRLGLTAGAMMIGLAFLTETWTNGPALFADLTERIRFADAFVFRLSGFTPADQQRIRTVTGVESAVAIGYLPLRLGGAGGLGVEGLSSPNVVCIGFPPREFLRLNRIDWFEGTPELALPLLESGQGVLVAREFLEAHHKHVGDELELGNARQTRPFVIAGVVGAAGLDVATQFFGIRSVYMEHAVSCVFMDFATVAREFGADEATIVQLQLEPGIGDQEEDRISSAIAAMAPGAQFASGRAMREDILSAGRLVMTLSSSAGSAMILLSCLAVGNIVAAGITIRRHEFGVMAACGAGPGVVARLILGETLLMAAAACVCGVAMGLILAWNGRELLLALGGIAIEAQTRWAAVALGCALLFVLALAAAVPATISLMRRPPRDLLSSARGS